MSASSDLLVDAFGRIRGHVHDAVEGLGPEDLAHRVSKNANTIAWLVWHLTRIQDDHVSDAANTEQVWTSQGWADRFGLPFPPTDTGYGHSSRQVASVRGVPAGLLAGYHDAVHEQTAAFVGSLRDRDLERIVDDSWTPAVTLGVRLVSVVVDDLQHVGQAAFVRGALDRHRT
jgi:uncharacterized damage-inducible protein DinB